jgi:glycosyltransferase involved in cell wall biosynthesis
MKIAYITINDPFDYKSWSGLNLNIYKCLKNTGNEVTCIGPLNKLLKLIYIPRRYISNLFGIKFDADRLIRLSKNYSSQVAKKIKNQKFDLIITSDTITVSYLKTKTPILLWLDASFYSWYNHYYSKLKISKKSLIEGNSCEQNAINKASKILVTSNWAKKEITRYYKCNANKINILPFGSNLEISPSLNKIKLSKNKFKKKICNIVSIGVDWERKGFSRTIKICKSLRSKGLTTHLTLIGSSHNKTLPSWVKNYSFLNKNIKINQKIISKILLKSDFHVLMTKSEAFGVAFAEASSHGVFNIAPNIGGIKGVIKNGINGKLFEKNCKNKKIVEYIYRCFMNKKKLKSKLIKTKLYYEKNLDWKIIGKNFNKISKNLTNFKR